MSKHSTSKKINIAVLIACILLVLSCFTHKHLYFDEAHYIMASKGVTQVNLNQYDSLRTITSAALDKENTFSNVYTQGLYNIALHYYTGIFGRSLMVHLSLSVLIGILILIAFYRLSTLYFGDSIYTSLCLVFFCTNMVIFNMMYDVTPYIFSVFCVVMSAIYFYKYRYLSSCSANLFLLGLWSAFGIMTHLFVPYIVAVYLFVLIRREKGAFFRRQNLIPLLAPVVLLCLFYGPQALFLIKYTSDYHVHATNTHLNITLSAYDAFQLFLKSVAINFKVIFPLFKDTLAIRISSFLLVLLIYIAGVKMLATDKEEQKKYRTLFALGIISCLFLAPLAALTNNKLLFSFRYYAFSIPFCCIFITIFIRGIFGAKKLGIAYKVLVPVLLILPGLYEFVANRLHTTIIPNNYVATTEHLQETDTHQIGVPTAMDAVFINSLLPAGYGATYHVDPQSTDFVLYKKDGTERIPAINHDIVLLY